MGGNQGSWAPAGAGAPRRAVALLLSLAAVAGITDLSRLPPANASPINPTIGISAEIPSIAIRVQARGRGNRGGQSSTQDNGQGNGQANGQGNGQASGQGEGQANGPGNGQANGPGNGQANGQGNGQANGQGNGQANGQGNGQANGQGNGQANGQGNGQANGQGNGQGNGQANGQANGQGNGQANGQGNGQGNGQANGQGNGQANGQGNGQANGQGNGQANGQGNGQANGQGNGQANGQGNGQANGQGNGQANGQGNGQANGQGNGQANGPGNGPAIGLAIAPEDGPPPAQAAATSAAEAVITQIQNLIEREIEPKNGANFNAALAGVYQHSFRDGLSVFTLSGVSRERHDGFTITSPIGSFDGAGFEIWTYGLTTGVRWDASDALGLQPSTLVFGGFGNISSSDLKVGGGSEPLIGEGAVRSYGLGGYSLFNSRPFYMLGIASHSWAHADLTSPTGEADVSPDSRGYIVSGSIGALLPAGGAFLDLRVGTTFAKGHIDDYRDAAGIAFTDSDLSEASGSASAKLLFTEHLQGTTLKPFLQAGVTQRFDQSNEIVADGVPYSFHDADLSIFGRIGVDISHGEGLQSYISVRGDKSEDREGIAGQFGFTLKLD